MRIMDIIHGMEEISSAYPNLFSLLIAGVTATLCFLAILLLGLALWGEGFSQGIWAEIMCTVPGLAHNPSWVFLYVLSPSGLVGGDQGNLESLIEDGEAAGVLGSLNQVLRNSTLDY